MSDQLEYVELDKFGGLWTAERGYLMPPDHAQLMNGCRPRPGGGLEPFFRVETTIPATGFPGSGALTAVQGLHTFLREANSGAANFGDRTDILIVTTDSGTPPLQNWNIRRWRQSFSDAAWATFTGSQWSAGVNSASGPGVGAMQPQFAQYGANRGTPPSVLIRDDTYLQFFADAAGNPDDLYWIADVDNLSGGIFRGTVPTIRALGRVAVEHQSRIVVGHINELRFADPPTEPTINIGGGDENRVVVGRAPQHEGSTTKRIASARPVWAVPIPPSDLLVCTGDGRMYNIQQDLRDPFVRELARWAPSAPHDPALTPHGVAVIFPNTGVHLLSPTGQLQNISPQIDPRIWSTFGQPGLGQVASYQNLLFVPNQHSSSFGIGNQLGPRTHGVLCHDFETNAWFMTQHPDDAPHMRQPKFMQVDNNTRGSTLWVATGGGVLSTETALHGIPLVSHQSTVPRRFNRTWQWRSAPFRAEQDRQIEAREVVLLFNDPFQGSTVRVQLLGVNGTVLADVTRTLPSGLSLQRFQFNVAPHDYVSVDIKATAPSANDTAPSLESFRLGWQPGRRSFR